MKTTARILSGLIAGTLGFSVALSFAAAQSEGPGVNPSPSGSTASQRFADARRQCDDLLRRSRQAMAENDLDAAAALLSQAERLGVQYGPLHIGDTPSRARRDLTRKQEAATSPARPGGFFSPRTPKSNQSALTDPFMHYNKDALTDLRPDGKSQAKACIFKARKALLQRDLAGATYWYGQAQAQKATFGPNEDSPEKLAADIRKRGGNIEQLARSATAPAGQGVRPLPSVDDATPLSRPLGSSESLASQIRFRASATTGRPSPDHAASDKLLLEARRALAVGDVRTATAKVDQAGQLRVTYGPTDDHPNAVRALILKVSDLSERRAEQGNSEPYRRQFAKVLLEQAQGLLRCRDYGEAERLAETASRQGITFGPFEAQPKSLLEQIAAERRMGSQRSTAGSRPGFAQAQSSGVPSSGAPAPSLAAKQRAVYLVRQARVALRSGDLTTAEDLARQAQGMQVPDSVFAPGEDRPQRVLQEVQTARLNRAGAVRTVGAEMVRPATGDFQHDGRADRALYDPANDPTRNVLAGSSQPIVPALAGPMTLAQQVPTPAGPRNSDRFPGTASSAGMALFQQGEAALKNHDADTALRYFRQASQYSNQLDPITAQRLQDVLQMLSAPAEGLPRGAAAPSMIDDTAARQQVLARQVLADVALQESNAERLLQSDPNGALGLLQEARLKVETAGLEPTTRQQLLRRVDRSLAETQQYIEQNRPRIELDERNRQVRQEIQRQREMDQDVREKLALAVDEFNQLIDEQRFAEAEVVAKRAEELDPENPLSQQLRLMARVLRRQNNNLALRDAKEQGFIDQMDAVDQASIPFNDMNPYVFPDAKQWAELIEKRRGRAGDGQRVRSPADLEIEQKLRTPVMLQFENAPLSQVMDYLAKLAGINLFLDPQGLAEEGVSSDDPVTITLSQEISLKSALNLILEPRHLSYLIKDEVLKVTSEQLPESEVYPRTYIVADLIVPIPNFIPNPRMGLGGAYHEALTAIGFGTGGPFGASASPLGVAASGRGSPGSADILAQISGGATGASTPMGSPMGAGPGGLGGGGMADFDTLMDLITTTIEPDSWEDVGGAGTIAPFPTNLSLVIRQTQQAHAEIVDLLEQLRRMQDLQVTIEVRFITLNDNFFERIGVDFDFDIDDDIDRPFQIFGRPDPTVATAYTGSPHIANGGVDRNVLDTDHGPSAAVGMAVPGIFSADLDIPFRQNSFELAVPQFGGFDTSAGAQLGFAILSDIEAFFFLSAAQGDRRSNIMQAPKVTLFNGQFASVTDTSTSPFVVSVIPVVGDFAAAQQPVIVMINEGTMLTVQAVVSDDRRFVRLTVVPLFSRIEKVDTFTFTGTTSTSTNSSQEGVQDDPDEHSGNSESRTVTTGGTTVQLPTVSQLSVSTTVSVPDGGTVLLGGIKRLSEGRSEFGVPMLNKLPYINRLFKNVGIGRETQSLMLMVTPRIIIQEEEEELLGIEPE